MPRFFTGEISGETAYITGEDARHLALSLRMKVGEPVTVCDAQGSDYQCVIVSIDPQEVLLRVQAVCPCAAEPHLSLTLYQAMPKGDKFEQIVQKAVELGACRVVPVMTKRCVSRPDGRAMAKKLERYNKIALEAAKQCGRGRIPAVSPMLDFEAAVTEMKDAGLALFFYENADLPLKTVISNKLQNDVSILIGSEGGFDPSEAAFAVDCGLPAVSLGSRILRCETAPLAAITAILYEAGDI